MVWPATAIPLTARVVCIADVYDALTSRRSYKERFTHEKAMDVMRQRSRPAFDPELFDQFEEMMREESSRTRRVTRARRLPT